MNFRRYLSIFSKKSIFAAAHMRFIFVTVRRKQSSQSLNDNWYGKKCVKKGKKMVFKNLLAIFLKPYFEFCGNIVLIYTKLHISNFLNFLSVFGFPFYHNHHYLSILSPSQPPPSVIFIIITTTTSHTFGFNKLHKSKRLTYICLQESC